VCVRAEAEAEVQAYIHSTLGPTVDVPPATDGPQRAILGTLREYQVELGAASVPEARVVRETHGYEEETLAEALSRLERRGEIYRPAAGHWSLTDPEEAR
jgi:hypothetical protein